MDAHGSEEADHQSMIEPSIDKSSAGDRAASIGNGMQSALGTIEHHENIVNLHLSLESFKTSLEILGFFLFDRNSEEIMKEKARKIRTYVEL